MPSSPALSTASSGHDYLGDEWPQMLDGSQWDGLNLLDLLSRGQSPFGPILDANLLLQEVKDKLSAEVIDIPRVHTGANNYGFHLKLSDQRHVLARLGRADVNVPHYDGFSLHWLHQQIDFEVATNSLLQNTPGVPTDRLLYHRHPLLHAGIKRGMPKDISGRRLMIFEMAQGQCRLWSDLDQQQRTSITSIFDWETGCIVPFALSEITFLVAGWNLTIDEDGEPSVYVRPGWAPNLEERDKNQECSAEFVKEIVRQAPYMEEVIHKVKEARYLWVKLNKWRGQNPEEFFGELGDWAEKRLAERGLSDTGDL
ncbi:hypothetical protein MRS44_014197 [Fusarium solani]|uniref:uncharacterized protein n=1 Tax=Fusarium solani TaxID=169388 RepID=UPI0032C46A85|nr:hypothetical protein MRS44_014197 [Fusarium solani]